MEGTGQVRSGHLQEDDALFVHSVVQDVQVDGVLSLVDLVNEEVGELAATDAGCVEVVDEDLQNVGGVFLEFGTEEGSQLGSLAGLIAPYLQEGLFLVFPHQVL